MEIRISKSDISKRSGCKEILEEANSLGTVRSIFHLAVVLLDALFENQTAENFSKAFAPKADAAKHLDTLSREFCPHLKYAKPFIALGCVHFSLLQRLCCFLVGLLWKRQCGPNQLRNGQLNYGKDMRGAEKAWLPRLGDTMGRCWRRKDQPFHISSPLKELFLAGWSSCRDANRRHTIRNWRNAPTTNL